MTKLSTIPQHQLSITCGLCKHHKLLEVANLIAIVGSDTTAHEVRQRARRMISGLVLKYLNGGVLSYGEATKRPAPSQARFV